MVLTSEKIDTNLFVFEASVIDLKYYTTLKAP